MFLKPNVEKIKIAGQKDKLVKLLKHRNAGVRESALLALNEIASTEDDILVKMRELISDKHMKVRSTAALIFARKGDPGVIDNLIEIISHSSVNDQIDVLRILPHYYNKGNDKITQIFAIALKDKKTSVQIEAIKSIGEMEIETMAFNLLEFATHPVSRFRFETVLSLGRIKNELGVDALIGALTDSSLEVRKIAEDALKKIGSERALRALQDAPFMLIVKHMNESVSKRLSTVINISRQKREFGLPLLHKACYDDYKSIRIEAIKGLGLLKDESSITVLIDLLNDKYYDVRIEVIMALSKYNTMATLNAIKNAMNDSNTNVRLEAKRAYASVSSRMDILGKRKS